MSYVYDIVLNFNNNYYEFYEWKKDDFISHIKRINLIRVDSKIYNEIIDNEVIFDEDFMLSIFNKCEYYNNRKIDSIPYAFLLTDKYRVIAIILDSSGKTIKYSSLLLEEEEDVLELCSKLGELSIHYRIINSKDKVEFRTRQENNIIKYIKKELKIDYEKNNISKLKYLYYEYFGKQNDNIDEIYQKLGEELDKNVNEKHYDLYNLIKLSYGSKSALN